MATPQLALAHQMQSRFTEVASLLKLPYISGLEYASSMPYIEVLPVEQCIKCSTPMLTGKTLRATLSQHANLQLAAAKLVREQMGLPLLSAYPIATLGSDISECAGLLILAQIEGLSATAGCCPLPKQMRELLASVTLPRLFNGVETEEEQGRDRWRDRLHQLINRLHRILAPNPIKHIVELEVGRPSSFLDIACGDDPLFLKVAEHARISVGNDFAGGGFRCLSQEQLPANALMTAYEASQFPDHEYRFEVSLCKCVIHHLNDSDHMERVLDRLAAVTSKRMIVVDIEAPTVAQGGYRTFFWNQYYRWMLNDQGRFFPGTSGIRDSLIRRFGTRSVRFQVIPTPRGKYGIAVVDL